MATLANPFEVSMPPIHPLEYGIDSLPAQEDKDKLGRMLMIPFERKKQRSLGDRQKWDSPEFLCPLLFGILANPTT